MPLVCPTRPTPPEPRPAAGPVLVGNLEPAGHAAWDAYVAAHPDGTACHTTAWLRACQRTFHYAPHYLFAQRGAYLCGVLPILRVRSWVAGTMLVSVPCGIYGGVLADDSAAAAALLDRARELARELDARVLELRSVRAAASDLPTIDRYATFRRELPAQPGEIDNWLPRKARAAARRAVETHALECRFRRDALETVWTLYGRTMRRLGSINYPLAFLAALAEEFGPNCRVQVVDCPSGTQRRPVAGLLTLLHGATALPYLVGHDDRYGIYGLTNFLYRESMRDAVAQGCTIYDFGRSRVGNSGAYRFKELMGFEPTPLAYQRFVPGGGDGPDLNPASSRWSAARAAWKHLPLPVTRWLGGRIAASIPG